jgi:hypothetical protein
MKKYALLVFVIPFFIGSCKKTDHSSLIIAKDFPTSIGSWWMYQVLDDNGNIQDTITYKILDVVSIGSFQWQRWTSIESHWYDTTYVLSTNTSIGFYKYADTNILYFKVNFPVIDNEIWTTPVQGVTYTTNLQNITVNGAAYYSVAYLNQYLATMQGYGVNESIWIARGIGIVRHSNLNSGIPLHFTDEHLIAYHIN